MLLGRHLGKQIKRPSCFRVLNLGMALLLLYVAGEIAYRAIHPAG
jgi:hypothetical protein